MTLRVNVLPHRANWELLRDRRLHAMGDAPLATQGITDGILHTYWTQGLLVAMDGEPHNRLRRLQNKVFAPNMVDRMRPAMREVAMKLAGRFADERACDFVAEFSTRYPVENIAGILGIPTDEISQFDRWSTDLALVFCFPVEPVRDRVERAISGLFEYLGELWNGVAAAPATTSSRN